MGDAEKINKEPDEEIQNQVKANILVMRAKNAYDRGDYVDSISLLKEALEFLPGNSSIWFELALSYRESNDIYEEIECYKRIVNIGFADAEIWLNMALAYRIISKPAEELYCLVMAADKGVEYAFQEDAKMLVVDRYRELTTSKVLARNPMSNEYYVPVYDPEEDKDADQGTCMVCFEKVDKVKEDGQLLMCPHCKRIAHFVCLASWLQQNEICPVCHGPLDFSLENYDFKKVMGLGNTNGE
ncbi:MAG: RING finger domain-containing protein [Promethearchaeota archaeon]